MFHCTRCFTLVEFKCTDLINVPEFIQRLGQLKEYNSLKTENQDDVKTKNNMGDDVTETMERISGKDIASISQVVPSNANNKEVVCRVSNEVDEDEIWENEYLGESGCNLSGTKDMSEIHSSSMWDVDTSLQQNNESGWIYTEHVDFMNHFDVNVRRKRLIKKCRSPSAFSNDLTGLIDYCNSCSINEFPLCQNCMKQRILEIEDETSKIEKDLEVYFECLTQCNTLSHDKIILSIGESENDYANLDLLKEEKLNLEEKHKFIDKEINQILVERNLCIHKQQELDKLHKQVCYENSKIQIDYQAVADESESSKMFLEYASEAYHRLQRYNVCNDSFHIWHDGQFGTINGLRLGRLPTKPVEWVEINAALGQTTMLLSQIIERSGFCLQKCTLVPRGSYSRIVVNSDGREYPLFSDGSFLKRRNFNQAITLLLACVDETGKQAIQRESSLQLPYRIEKGKIGDLSITLGDDEQWTRALKYMLTHLKWLLAWVTKRQS